MIYDQEQSNSNLKYILFWDKFYNLKNWKIGPENVSVLRNEFFEQNHCKFNNCIFTSDKSLLNSVTDFDAVIFHVTFSRDYFKPTPEYRSPRQRYIMATNEPPKKSGYYFSQSNNYFNWTMTYRLDSDLVWTSGKIMDKITKEIIAPSLNPKWRKVNDDFYNQDLMELILNKTSLVGWLVSNCITYSRREIIVERLQKYVPVDIYGKCGSLKCAHQPYCYQMMEKKYKFYISFENDVCLDYATEKIFSILEYNMIPIVYGGANYSLFAPPKSYINFADFASIKDLAHYLIYLDRHPEEYIKYFWYKEFYVSFSYDIQVFCDLCIKLNVENSEKNVQIYNDIANWWRPKCFL